MQLPEMLNLMVPTSSLVFFTYSVCKSSSFQWGRPGVCEVCQVYYYLTRVHLLLPFLFLFLDGTILFYTCDHAQFFGVG